MRTDRPYKSHPAKFADTCKRPGCPRRSIAVGEEISHHKGQVMHGVCANTLHGTLPEYAAWIDRLHAHRARHRSEIAKHRALLRDIVAGAGA